MSAQKYGLLAVHEMWRVMVEVPALIVRYRMLRTALSASTSTKAAVVLVGVAELRSLCVSLELRRLSTRCTTIAALTWRHSP